MWENMVPGTKSPFCAGIGPLQHGVVVVFYLVIYISKIIIGIVKLYCFRANTVSSVFVAFVLGSIGFERIRYGINILELSYARFAFGPVGDDHLPVQMTGEKKKCTMHTLSEYIMWQRNATVEDN